MKLTCSCGHPNHVHFAGTGRCHGRIEKTDSLLPTQPCECQRFVPKIVEQRADLV